MIGIIGKKVGMTQIFNEQGHQIPVTVVEAPPNSVLQMTNNEAGTRPAVQLGLGAQRMPRESKGRERTPRGRRALKPSVGHAAKAGLEAPPAFLRSFRLDDAPGKKPEVPTFEPGAKITVEIFSQGEIVKVTGTSRGRGFQGVVKRHGMGGGPNTHGNTKHRRPGSVGAGTNPSRVIKGKKMPGHYGSARHTQRELRVERVDAANNLIYIRGSIAGPKNGLVLVSKQS
jgi:large subunit ribosomal protein L3